MLMDNSLIPTILIAVCLGYAASAIVIKAKQAFFLRHSEYVLELLFVVTLALFSVALCPPLNAYVWLQGHYAVVIYGALLLLVANISALNHYVQHKKDTSLRLIFFVRINVITALFIPICALYLSLQVAAYALAVAFLLSAACFIQQLRELKQLRLFSKEAPQMPLMLLLIATSVTLPVIQFAPALIDFIAIPWFLVLIVITSQILITQNLSTKPIDDDNPFEVSEQESLDDLNQALADQNLELQLTLRELREKNQELSLIHI